MRERGGRREGIGATPETQIRPKYGDVGRELESQRWRRKQWVKQKRPVPKGSRGVCAPDPGDVKMWWQEGLENGGLESCASTTSIRQQPQSTAQPVAQPCRRSCTWQKQRRWPFRYGYSNSQALSAVAVVACLVRTHARRAVRGLRRSTSGRMGTTAAAAAAAAAAVAVAAATSSTTTASSQ